jgi:hypothetical protein
MSICLKFSNHLHFSKIVDFLKYAMKKTWDFNFETLKLKSIFTNIDSKLLLNFK